MAEYEPLNSRGYPLRDITNRDKLGIPRGSRTKRLTLSCGHVIYRPWQLQMRSYCKECYTSPTLLTKLRRKLRFPFKIVSRNGKWKQ